MSITQIYTIIVDAVFDLILMISVVFSFLRFFRFYIVLLVKNLLYLHVLRRHRFFESWTRAQVLLHLLYLTVNIFCSIFEVFFVKELDNRTGILSLINMILSYFDYHLSFVSNMLDLFILNYQRIHASIEVMFVFLSLFHAVINVVSVTNLKLFSVFNQLFEFIVNLKLLWKWYED